MEVALREREVGVKEAELELKRKEHASAGWRSPLVIAVLAAALGALGNAYVTSINASLQRELEDQKAEQQRLLEAIKTGDPDGAAVNLQFMLDAGLISEPKRVKKLREFLASREPGTGPVLPAPSATTPAWQREWESGKVGPSDAIPTTKLTGNDALRKVVGAVGQVRAITTAGSTPMCTAFAVDERTILTVGYCVRDAAGASLAFVVAPNGRPVTYSLQLPPKKLMTDRSFDYALVSVTGGPPLQNVLRLSAQPPAPDERLAMVLFRSNDEQLVAADEDCRVLKIDEKKIHHGCDAGRGSSGAPLMSADGRVVYGVHDSRLYMVAGHALRSDRILTDAGSLLQH